MACKNHPEDVIRNLENIPFYGRWDDLYALVGTPVEDKMFYLMKQQLVLDLKSKTPSLLAKWLKSENTSSHESRQLATLTRKSLILLLVSIVKHFLAFVNVFAFLKD